MRIDIRCLVLVFVMSILNDSVLNASILIYQFDDKTNLSDIIIIGKVIDIVSNPDKQFVNIEIIKKLKGECDELLSIDLSKDAYRLEKFRKLKWRKFFFFLLWADKNNVSQCKLLGGTQGYYEIMDDDKVFNGREYIETEAFISKIKSVKKKDKAEILKKLNINPDIIINEDDDNYIN